MSFIFFGKLSLSLFLSLLRVVTIVKLIDRFWWWRNCIVRHDAFTSESHVHYIELIELKKTANKKAIFCFRAPRTIIRSES